MSGLVELISAKSVSPGESAEVVADGRIFAVFNVDGTFHVLDGICPHAGGPLGKGTLDRNIVTCPWHGWQFQVDSGQHCLNPTLCQPSYSTQVVNDMVCVNLDDEVA